MAWSRAAGKDRGAAVRQAAKQLDELLNDSEAIKNARAVAAKNRVSPVRPINQSVVTWLIITSASTGQVRRCFVGR